MRQGRDLASGPTVGEAFVPIEFLRRRGGNAPNSRPARAASPARVAIPEEVAAQDHQVRLSYAAKSSEGIRLGSNPDGLAELPGMVGSLAKTPVEVVEPRAMDSGQASPSIVRTAEARAWL